MFFVSSCNNLRPKPLLGTVRVPPPPPADKNWQSSREISVNGREKKSQRETATDIEIYCWFSFLQSCQTATVPEGDYLHKPLGLSPCASSDNMARDLYVAACCLQNCWRQNPSIQILNLWQDLGSDIVWSDLLSASNNKKKPLGASSGNAAFPEFSSLCKKLLLRGAHTEPSAWDSAVFPLPHQSDIVCLVLEAKAPYHLCQLYCSFPALLIA